VLFAALFAVTLGLIIADVITWAELDVATLYGLPLVLAGATRSRRLLWILMIFLTITTFVVYAFQIPVGAFTLHETFFVNRVLDTVALLLTAGVLHIWMNSADASEALAQLIQEQNKKLETAKVSRRLVEVQEAERRVLANHLHDLVGQNLAVLSVNLNIVKGQLSPGQATQIGVRLEDSLKLVEETTESIRDVMSELRPAVLDNFGLTPVLRWYTDQFTKRTGVSTSMIEHGPLRRLPSVVEEALYRITQEALSNVAKYAKAQKAVVTLDATPQVICLTIADDGCGFDPTADHQPTRDHGWGLMIMRERAEAVGAQLNVESAHGRGTQVIVRFRIGAP
jgi:signal transduction histidine kinase